MSDAQMFPSGPVSEKHRYLSSDVLHESRMMAWRPGRYECWSFFQFHQEIRCIELTGSQSLLCSYPLVFGCVDVESKRIQLSVCSSWFQVSEYHSL